MNKRKIITVLGGLLIAQIALAVGLNLGANHHGAYVAQGRLVPFDKDAVDTIRLADNTSDLTIRKKDGKWLLPDINFPADGKQVDNLLDRLAAMKKDYPVATTADAADHFKVGKKSFKREISLLQGKKVLARLYLGDSPGVRKIYARRDGADAIHTVKLATYQVNPDDRSWLDKDILAHPVDDIVGVTLSDIALKRGDDGHLVLDKLDKNQQTDGDRARDLVGKLAKLRIENVLGTDDKPDFDQNKPKDVLKIALKGGKEITYTVSKPKDKGYYVLKSSDHPNYFAVATYALDPVLKTKRAALVQAKTEKSGAPMSRAKKNGSSAKPSNS